MQMVKVTIEVTGVVKHGQVSRKEKDMRCVVFCIPKGYEATGAAHLGRLQCSSLVERKSFKLLVAGSSPVIDKTQSSAPVLCERCLILYSQENTVCPRPQAKDTCSARRRSFLAEANCSQGRRNRNGRLA